MERIAIGAVRTSFGVRGWLKLASYSGEWGHFASLESIVLEDRKTGRRTSFRVAGFRMQSGEGLVKLAGIDSPEEGRAFSGWEILVPREFGAPLNDGEWYLDDLVGLTLRGPEGEIYGEVVAVIESSDDILEIRRPDGTMFMVPFRSQFVGEPDLKSGILVLTETWLAERL